jgi:hypothetical protein
MSDSARRDVYSYRQRHQVRAWTPRSRGLTMASTFAKKLASIALEQHATFQFMNEAEPALCSRIQSWTEDIGSPFTSCTKVPWSAVFVSWCMKRAGATKTEFKFSMSHSVFAHQAIKNAIKQQGVFQGFDINQQAPDVGDVIHYNRDGNKFTFEFAKTHSDYKSHSVIVVEVGEDSLGRFAFCVGGNESDSIRRTTVRLDASGFIKKRDLNPFISLIKNLK